MKKITLKFTALLLGLTLASGVFATENHQEYNAQVLKNVGSAEIIQDKNLTYTRLNNEINNMIKDKEKLAQMGEKAMSVAQENVEEKIYQEIKMSINVENCKN